VKRGYGTSSPSVLHPVDNVLRRTPFALDNLQLVVMFAGELPDLGTSRHCYVGSDPPLGFRDKLWARPADVWKLWEWLAGQLRQSDWRPLVCNGA